MSIDRLSIILKDAYEMDIEIPHRRMKKSKFEKISYSIWAIDELKTYIAGRLFPRRTGSIGAFITYTKDFYKKMKNLSIIKSNDNTMFLVAMDITRDVLDILHAMQ